MTTLIMLALPALLLSLLMEVRDGRASATEAAIDGGLAMSVATLVLRLVGTL